MQSFLQRDLRQQRLFKVFCRQTFLLLFQGICNRLIPVMLPAQIAGNRIQILQLAVLILIGSALQKTKEGFLCQIFCSMLIMQTEKQISENTVILVFQIHSTPSFPNTLYNV